MFFLPLYANVPNFNKLVYSNRLVTAILAVYCCVIESADSQVQHKTAIVGEKVSLECNVEKPVPESQIILWKYSNDESSLLKLIQPMEDDIQSKD